MEVEALLAHEAWVRRLARALVRDESEADDVVQQVWVAALERPPRPSSARAWLSTVTRRVASKARRGDVRRDARERSAARSEAVRSTADVVEEAELHGRVVQAVLALDEPYREAVLLRFFEDLPPREIARRCRCPVETVRSRVRRGLALLRESLDRDHGGDRSAWYIPMLALGQSTSKAAPAVAAGALAMTAKATLSLAALLVLGVATAFVAWRGARPQAAAPRTSSKSAERPRAAAPGGREHVAAGEASAPRETVASSDAVKILGRVVRSDNVEAARFTPYAVGDVEGERRLLDVTTRIGSDTFEMRIPFASEERSWPIDVGIHGRGFLRRVRALEVEAGGTYRVDVALEAGLSLKGEVDDPDGNPLPGLEILAVPSEKPASTVIWGGSLDIRRFLLQTVQNLTHFARGKTDVTGRFELRGVGTGTYAVLSLDESWFITHKGAIAAEALPAALRAVPALALHGRVRDARTNKPVPNARANWTSEGSTSLGTRVVEGRVLAIWTPHDWSEVLAHGFVLTVEADGYHGAKERLMFEEGEHRGSFDVALEPVETERTGTVRVALLDAWQRPCEEAVTFRVTDADGGERVISVQPDKSGAYLLSTAVGRWRLAATLDDEVYLPPWRGEIEVVEEREVFVRCELPPFGIVRVRCVGDARRWSAHFLTAEGSETAFTRSGELGEEVRLLLPPGEWRIVLSGSTRDAASREVVVRAGEEQLIEIPE